jgi:anaerobic ribonucleoside-triphosphate reductase activating protein
MRALISRIHYPVSVLGPGRRAGIWFQGCSIRCPGCVSVDTWRVDQRNSVEVDDVLSWLLALPPEAVDGVTISGGEPTEQPAALAELLRGIDTWRAARSGMLPVLDVLVFTGREPGWLETVDAEVLHGTDAVVAGPFEAGQAGTAPLRGSDNQRLVALTALGRERYAEARLPPRNAMQVAVVDGGIWMIGIPLPGDLAGVQAVASGRGVRWRGTSWTS